MDAIVGAWGGRPGRDGIDGVTPIAVNISNVPIETLEMLLGPGSVIFTR